MEKLASYIDHTNLKAYANKSDIVSLCEEALEHSFASVCVNPNYVKLCRSKLKDSPVKVCTVIGFPLGAHTVETKLFEAKNAMTNGAEELDMVINISNVKDKNFELVESEILALKESIGGRAVLKVIIETALLDDFEKIKLAEICRDLRVDYIKTSTGFSTGGATIEDIKLIKSVVGSTIGIKASGGIKTYEAAKDMIKAGATRIGASSSVDIVKSI